jgi:hypothetical protein
MGEKSELLTQEVKSKINTGGKIADETTGKGIKKLCDSFIENDAYE